RRPVPGAGSRDYVDGGPDSLVDLAPSNPLRRPGVEGPERDRRRRRPKPRLQVRRQRASGLDKDQRPNKVGTILGDAEGDMPSPGMADEMDRPALELSDEARDVRDVLLHGEIVAVAVPLFRPAMPEAHRDRAVMSAERRHLSSPVPAVAERAMHEKQGLARPPLDERHVIAVHSQSRHPLSPTSAPRGLNGLERGSRKGKPAGATRALPAKRRRGVVRRTVGRQRGERAGGYRISLEGASYSVR